MRDTGIVISDYSTVRYMHSHRRDHFTPTGKHGRIRAGFLEEVTTNMTQKSVWV